MIAPLPALAGNTMPVLAPFLIHAHPHDLRLKSPSPSWSSCAS